MKGFTILLVAASNLARAQSYSSSPSTLLQTSNPGANFFSGNGGNETLLHSPGYAQLNGVLKDRTITLDEAVRIALGINRDLAKAAASFYSAKGRTAEAYAAMNPTIGAILTGLRFNEKQTTTSLISSDPSTLATPIGKSVAVQNVQQQIVSLGSVLPIDISGSLSAAANQQKYIQKQYLLDMERTTNDVVAEVKSSFYNVLRARALRTVAQDNLKNSQVRLTDAQNKYAAQVVTKFDVLRAQVDVANAQQQLITASNNVESLYAALNDTIGIMVSTRLHVSDQGAVQDPEANPGQGLSPKKAIPSPSESPAVEAARQNLGPEFAGDLKEALTDRPEILESEAGISSAKWGVKYAQRSELPSAALGYSYNYLPNAGGLHPYTHVWTLQAQISIPIWDGGLASARRKEALGAEWYAESQARSAEDQVALEVQEAYLATQQARERVRVADETLAEAHQAFAIAQRRYNSSVSPLIELSDSQNALNQAETNQVNALYDYNSAETLLDRAIGRFAEYDLPPAKLK